MALVERIRYHSITLLNYKRATLERINDDLIQIHLDGLLIHNKEYLISAKLVTELEISHLENYIKDLDKLNVFERNYRP